MQQTPLLQKHLPQPQQTNTRFSTQPYADLQQTTQTAPQFQTINTHPDNQFIQSQALGLHQIYQPSTTNTSQSIINAANFQQYQLPQHPQGLAQYGQDASNILNHQAAAPNSGQSSSNLQQQHITQYQQQTYGQVVQQPFTNGQSSNFDILSTLTNQLQGNANVGIEAQSTLNQIQALLLAQQPQQQQAVQTPYEQQQQQPWQSQPPQHLNQQQSFQNYGQSGQYLAQHQQNPSTAPIQHQQPVQQVQSNPLALVGMLNELQKNLTAIIQCKQGSSGNTREQVPHRSHFMKYFVGGILYSARETDIERYMRDFGKVVDVAIMRDKHSGRSRGFAFVTFEANSNDSEQCERLNRIMLEENRHSIGGRNVEIREGDGNKPADSFLAKDRDESSTASQPQSSSQRRGNRSSKRSRSRSRNRGESSRKRKSEGKSSQKQGGGARDKVFVGGLDYQLSEDEFKEFFGEFGQVKEVQIVKDPNNNASRGFGFVTFQEESVAQHLILKVQKAVMSGRTVDLRSAEPKVQSTEKNSSKNRD